jgi:hypothetical protein
MSHYFELLFLLSRHTLAGNKLFVSHFKRMFVEMFVRKRFGMLYTQQLQE